MAENHPASETLRLFVAGELAVDQSLKLVWHLYNCSTCRQEVEHSFEGATLLARLFAGLIKPMERTDPEAYEEAIERGLSLYFTRQEEMECRRHEAPELFLELARHPSTRQTVMVRNSKRFQSWALCDHVLDHCEQAWFERHQEAEALAALALEIALSLPPAASHPSLLGDLRARCWTYIANSRRVCGDLPGAEQAFHRAEQELAQGSDDPQERAHLLRRKGSLLTAQRRFRDAEATFSEAARLFRTAGDDHSAGKTLVSLANIHFVASEPERAIHVLGRASELVDPERDPALTLGMRHNLIDYLVETGQAMQARSLLVKSRELYDRHANASLRRKALWVRGRIARGLGQLQQAEGWFLQARQAYIEQSLAFEFALVSLELAELYSREGRTAEVLRMAEEILPIFQALEIQRETLAALALFVDTARKQRVTTALLKEVAARLRDEQQPHVRDAPH